MDNKKTKLLNLYLTFCKIGLFTFGGGYAALPIIEREVCINNKWSTEEEIVDYYAISQMTPGIIMINVATFVGYKQRGVLGGIVSTLGVISPCLVIITLIATLIENFASIPVVQSALKGIAAGICAIIITSLIKLAKKSIKDIFGIVLAIVSFIFAYFTDVSILIIVAVGIFCGLIRKKTEVRK